MNKELESFESRALIKELYQRGVPMKDVFGAYYELEEAADARTMDIEDAQLVGLVNGSV